MYRRTLFAAVRLVSLGVLAALIATGCSGGSAPAPNVPAGGTVSVRIIAQIPTLDPHLQGSKGSIQIDNSLYDWLVFWDGHKIVPYLATSWQATPTSAKFTLRKNATCADGTPVTPTVVANSFKRFLLSSDPGIVTQRRGWPAPFSVSADDSADSVTVGIGRPFSGLLTNFSQLSPAAAIVCPHGLANPASLATVPDGSGPYRLTSLAQGDNATVQARPDWHWGPDGMSTKSPGVPQTVVFKVVVNETTAANLLETGGLDVATIVGSDNTRLSADHSLIHKTAHGYYGVRLEFNQGAGHPTADQAVRQALATAIDPNLWGKAAYGGSMVPTSSFLTPDANCFDPSTRSMVPTPDVAKAKQIMSAAGYQAGTDGTWLDKNRKPMTITMWGEDNQGGGPEYALAQFTAAGFNVKFSKVDEAGYRNAYLTGNWDTEVNNAISSVPDPNGNGTLALFSGRTPPAGSNYTRMDYPDIDSEIAAANAATGSESCKHWAKVQQDFLNNYIFRPIGAPQYQWYGRGLEYLPFVDTFVSPIFLKRVK